MATKKISDESMEEIFDPTTKKPQTSGVLQTFFDNAMLKIAKDEKSCNTEKRAAALNKLGKDISSLLNFLVGKTNVHKEIHKTAAILKNDFDLFVQLDEKMKSTEPAGMSSAEATTQKTPTLNSSVSESPQRGSPRSHHSRTQGLRN